MAKAACRLASLVAASKTSRKILLAFPVRASLLACQGAARMAKAGSVAAFLVGSEPFSCKELGAALAVPEVSGPVFLVDHTPRKSPMASGSGCHTSSFGAATLVESAVALVLAPVSIRGLMLGL